MRLDRLGRSMTHLVSIIEDLGKRGIFFKSVSDSAVDTTTASGELVFNIFSSLAQFERKLIQERTKAGLSAARARGNKAFNDENNGVTVIIVKFDSEPDADTKKTIRSLGLNITLFEKNGIVTLKMWMS